MQLAATLTQLDYFTDAAISRYPGASDAQLAEAQMALGVTFPPSLLAFLRMTNGLGAIDYRFFGVGQPTPPGNLVEETLRWRDEMDRQVIAVASDDFGNAFVLLPEDAGADGEWPVAFLDHENPKVLLVASSFERFCWFAFDDLQRQYQPDGEYRPRGKSSGWKFRNQAWVLKQDPALKALRTPPPVAVRPARHEIVGTMQSETPLSGGEWTADGATFIIYNWTHVLLRTAAGDPIADIGLKTCPAAAAISPDRRRLVTRRMAIESNNDPGSFQWWDPITARCLAESVPEQEARALAFSNDSALLAVGQANTVNLFHGEETTPAHRLELEAGVLKLRFSADARLLAVAGKRNEADGYHGEVSLWDYAAGACVKSFDMKRSRPTSIELSLDASLLACTAMNKNATGGEILVWRGLAKNTPAIHLKGFPEIARTLALSPDASLLVSGYVYLTREKEKRSDIFCWDIRESGQLLYQLTLPGRVADITFLDQRTVALLVITPEATECQIVHWYLT